MIESEDKRLRELIASRRPGHGLPGEFYRDDLIHRADIERIWRRGWLFVGHSCEIREPGDYFTFDLCDDDSLIVVRGDEGETCALHNTCRHRGTLVCAEPSGKVNRFVCPYHQWTYAKDGRLLACKGMHDEIDRSNLGLFHAHVRELQGLIFVCLANEAPDFEEAASAIGPLARPQGFAHAKVAKIVDYEIEADWKLVWENNRECYHCNVNHPQYTKANYDHYNADDASERVRHSIEQATARFERKWAGSELEVTHRQSGMAIFPDPDRGLWYSANRTMLAEGFVTESVDGRQVAPLMGNYREPDVGTLRIRTMPNFWVHASCDHVVSTRLLPRGPHRTRARVTWLVDKDAVEGKDYELAAIMPFWQLTSEQDWELCERAQRGVRQRRFVPGPYSTYKEYNVDGFVRWYLDALADALADDLADDQAGTGRRRAGGVRE